MKTHLLALLSLFCIGTALAQTPRDERIARAVERMDDGDYDEAARLLESVLAADPKNFLANYETACRSFIGHFYQEFGEYHPEFHFSDYHYQCFRYRDKLIHRFICFCRSRCRYGIERYTAKFCRWSDDTAFQTV